MRVKWEKYKTFERRLYVKRGTILVERINKKNQHSYKRIERTKTYPITQESFNIRTQTFYNELATLTPTPEKLEKRKEEAEEFEEYEYFVGFDYETPTITVEGKSLYKKGKHDFKTEFKVSSPVKLSDTEIKQLIQSKISDYKNVLQNDESYNIKSHTKRPSKSKPDFEVKFTEKITR